MDATAEAAMGQLSENETGDETEAATPFYWDRYRDTTLGRYLFEREHRFIRRALGWSRRPGRLLDLGSGSGRLTLPLRGAGYDVVGLDLSPVALAAFRRRSQVVPLVRADAGRLPFVDDSFDGVIAIQSLDYVEHRGFMRECSRVLRPGGLLVFDALNRRSYKWHLKNRVGRQLVLPSADLDYRQVLRAAVDHGFEVRAISGYNWVPFTRQSDSNLVRAAAFVESALRLDRYYQISPKILVAARRTSS